MIKRTLLLALCFVPLFLMAQENDPALSPLLNENDPAALQQRLDELGNGDEKDLALLIQYYRATRAYSRADSIQQMGAEKFPKSHMAASVFIQKMFGENDPGKKREMLKNFKKNFPDEDRDRAYFAMLYTMAKDKETLTEAIKFSDMIREQSQRLTAAYHTGANLAVRVPELAEPYISRKLKEFKYLAVAPPPDSTNRQAMQEQSLYGQMQYYYGKVLADKGAYKAAYPYLKTFYEQMSGPRTEVSIVYANVLVELGYNDQAFPILDKLVRDAKANAPVKNQLATVYTQLHPGKDGKAYVATIEKEINEKITEEYIKAVVKEASPDFVVLDDEGKKVSLKDFRGKTIVLDFWATWCGPCKKSFPAMQRVVNKYKADPEVKFLFIHTWETSDTPLKDAQAYLSANHYNFDLYIDPKGAEPNSNKAAALFGFRGIPQKYVIDGKGNIRFRITGFGHGDDAAVKELSLMIDYAKQNS